MPGLADLISASPQDRRRLYPPLDTAQSGFMETGDGHQIYYEVCGNPDGKPVIFVHGGPGGGTSPMQRRFFDPTRYRIVLFDQRGCGKSQPFASLDNNTTWHLIHDMEQLRQHLSIERWQVFGGSWGSTLALLYAQAHPDRVSELVLRGIFLMRKREVDWFYQFGTHAIFPEAWERFISVIPLDERDDVIGAFYRRLTGNDETAKLEAARAWSQWEASVVTLVPDERQIRHAASDRFAIAFARIECHYFLNRGFLSRDNQILEDCPKLADIPTVIVQGRYDAICPPVSAWELHQAMPHANLRLVPVAGHSAFEPDIAHELVKATDAFAH